MADANSNSKQPESLQAFSWLNSDAQRLPAANFVASTYDMARGIRLVLKMLEADFLRQEDGASQALSQDQRGTLMRFTIAAADSIQSDARQHIDRLNDQGERHARQAAQALQPSE